MSSPFTKRGNALFLEKRLTSRGVTINATKRFHNLFKVKKKQTVEQNVLAYQSSCYVNISEF